MNRYIIIRFASIGAIGGLLLDMDYYPFGSNWDWHWWAIVLLVAIATTAAEMKGRQDGTTTD